MSVFHERLLERDTAKLTEGLRALLWSNGRVVNSLLGRKAPTVQHQKGPVPR